MARSVKTIETMTRMLEVARQGFEILPAYFNPIYGGTNSSVSAAIRALKADGLIEHAGLDGLGRAKYRMVEPKSTHAAPATAQ